MNNTNDIRRAIADSVRATELFSARLGGGANKNPYSNGTDPLTKLDWYESDPTWIFAEVITDIMHARRGTQRIEINGHEHELPFECVFFPLIPNVSNIVDDEVAASFLLRNHSVNLAKFFRIEDRQTRLLFRLQYGGAA